MADEPDNLVLVMLREICAKQNEHSTPFEHAETRLTDIEKQLDDYRKKWIKPQWRQALICALISVAGVAFSTRSESQAPNPQPQSIAIKAEAASLCALVGKMQVIAFKYSYDPATAEPRELEPYGVGYTQKRNVLLFGRQVKGYSKSADDGADGVPGWRNFRIDKIKLKTVNALVSTFDAVRPEPDEYRYISEFLCKNDSVR